MAAEPSPAVGNDGLPDNAASQPEGNVENGELDGTSDDSGNLEVGGPIAVIQCAEGDEVLVKTSLHLCGDQSYSSTGEISRWQWTVERPGSAIWRCVRCFVAC